MSQVERGGQNVLRWPAELPETDNPEGSVGEEARDRDEQSERLAALPGHEQDPDEATDGAGAESGLPMGDSAER